MPIVNFVEENISIEVEEDTILLDAIRRAGLNIETPCNAMGFCGKCKVVAKGVLSEEIDKEKKVIDESKFERLSCIARVQGNVEVILPKREEELKTINMGKSIQVELNSQVNTIEIPKINVNSIRSLSDSIDYNISSIQVYSKLANTNYKEGMLGLIYNNSILDIINKEKEVYGIALDIGTTGMSYYLINIKTGQVVKKKSSLNPQTIHGGDVLSRITFCMENSNGSSILKDLIVDEINKSICEMVDNIEDVYNICVAANTTMLHLLLGINPEMLAKSPYKSVFLDIESFNPIELGIAANKGAILEIIPCASSYVGGDIISGILASDFQNNNKALFIDIGTNGEMATIIDNEIFATSTAAGPALEGMNIECGCRAQSGAVEAFDIDEEYKITYKTIEDKKAIGICGSGLIDIVASLVKRDVLTKTGRWNKNLNEKLSDRLIDKKFYITDDIYISQKDIRQIQLAKGAIAAGVILLLKEKNITIDDIETVYIAGAFGYHVDAENMKIIGLIPSGFSGNIEFLGNTSLEGARLSIMNKNFSKKLKVLSKQISVIELSLNPNFQDVFVGQLNF